MAMQNPKAMLQDKLGWQWPKTFLEDRFEMVWDDFFIYSFSIFYGSLNHQMVAMEAGF